jgi:glutamate N-acetyltransferase/amino-acid N-acetyltransferase
LARNLGSGLRAVLINAGNANACTGAKGLQDAEYMARQVEATLGIPPDSVFIMSTGIIGHHLPLEKLKIGIRQARQALSAEGGVEAARAIMTTDLVPKEASIHFTTGGISGTIGSMTKGSGMIHPDLKVAGAGIQESLPKHATMLAVLVTDVPVATSALQQALSHALDRSFNRLSVDGDTSTNDTVVLLAGGQAGNPMIETGSAGYQEFEAALTAVCVSLARQIARDGEGATKIVEIVVEGAMDHTDAVQAAKTVATSPLVKTAIFGADPNWGRVLAAVGRSGARIDPSRTALWLNDIQLVEAGVPRVFDESAARAVLSQPEVRFLIRLGLGSGQATVWTCDLSYKYVEINAEYHT